KPDSSLDAAARGAPSLLAPIRRVREQIFEQLAPHGAMTVAIEFDVPIDVVDEITHAIVVVFGAIERIEKPAEHLWNDVFAAVEEGRQDLFRRARIGQRHRMRDKGLHMGWCADLRQGYFDRNADQHQRAEPAELAGAGAEVPHGAGGEIEGADIGSDGIDLRLPPKHNV